MVRHADGHRAGMTAAPLCMVLLCLLLPSLARAQAPPIKNPTRAVFTPGIDHALVTGYELDIVDGSGAVVQTLTFVRQTPDANGEVTLTFNVQPVAFGVYRCVVRNVYLAILSINSNTSDPWERAPGQPSKPKVQ